MRTALFFLLVLLAAGCARKKLPPAVVVPMTQVNPEGGEVKGNGSPNYGNPANQGISPSQWAEQLQNRDHAERSRASMALGRMGEAGYAPLRDGMRGKQTEVRLACLQTIGKPVLVAHRDEMLPLLIGLLSDADPRIRSTAASRLSWFGGEGRSALPALQALAEKDEEPEVQQVARLSIEIIEYPNGRPPEPAE